MDALSDEKLSEMLYLALIPRVTGSVDDQYATTKSWTRGLQMLWATQLVDDEVHNGGFNQYFFNSSGQWAVVAIEGFRLIEAWERAEIVQRAVDQFFAEAPQLRRYYQTGTIESFSESYKHTGLGRLDKLWYAAPDFYAARVAYIRRHPNEFLLEARP